MTPELERNEQHNVLIPKFLRAELQRLHYEHQRKTGRYISYAAFFRDIVLAEGMIELGERYVEP